MTTIEPTHLAHQDGNHLHPLVSRVDGPTWWALERRHLAAVALDGTLVRHDLPATTLRGNPLGDPAVRALVVQLPPGYQPDRTYPLVLVLHGAGTDAGFWFADDAATHRGPHAVERAIRSGAEPAVVAYVDAWTSLGGSQYLDSPAIGNYQSYLTDDVIPFLHATYPINPDSRSVIGHSSGGFGALRLALDRPGTARRIAALAADALFEGVHLTTLMPAARRLQTAHATSYGRLWASRSARAQRGEPLPNEDAEAIDQYMLAAAYSWPDLVFDPATGELRHDVWTRWLRQDPLRMIRDAHNLSALRQLDRIHLAAGSRDTFHADVAARALAAALTERHIPVVLDIFDADHVQVADLERPFSVLGTTAGAQSTS